MAELLSNRIPYHSDGSIVRVKTATGWKESPRTAVAAMNSVFGQQAFINESVGLPFQGAVWARDNVNTTDVGEWQILFAVPMDIDAAFLPVCSGGIQSIATSVFGPRQIPVKILYSHDTMGGDDGTWFEWGVTQNSFIPMRAVDPSRPQHSVYAVTPPRGSMTSQTEESFVTSLNTAPGSFYMYPDTTAPDYLGLYKHIWESFDNGGAQRLGLYNIRGLRFQTQAWPGDPAGYTSYSSLNWTLSMFLYGAPTDGFYDYIQVEDVTSGKSINQHETSWGTVAVHSSADKKVRVRNMSWNRTAKHVTISITPDNHLPFYYEGMFLFSLDRVRWDEELILYNLGPDTASQTIYMRRVTGAEFPEGFGEALISARVGKWV